MFCVTQLYILVEFYSCFLFASKIFIVFLRFPRDSQDSQDFLGIPRISLGFSRFPGFPRDSRDFYGIRNPGNPPFPPWHHLYCSDKKVETNKFHNRGKVTSLLKGAVSTVYKNHIFPTLSCPLAYIHYFTVNFYEWCHISRRSGMLEMQGEMRDIRHIPRETVHLPRDMHLPTHPAVKNDEIFFHSRETGDGDAGYRSSPAGYAYPGLVPG
jgi:hypothetical protein